MLIIQKLYIKDFFKVMATLALGLSFIFSIIGLIDRVEEFMPHNPSLSLLLQYTLLNVPRYLHYLLPMATLLSSLFIFSQAVNRKEIIVIKASSGKMKTILRPFVWLGIMLILLGFVLGEVIVPATSKKVHSIKNQITHKGKRATFKEGTLYMRAKDGSIVRIALYLPNKNISKGITIFKFETEGLRQRIDAKTAEWKADVWELKNVTLSDIAEGRTTELPTLVYEGIESPKIFLEEMWNVEEMTIMELIKYQGRLKEAGFKNIKLTVDISSRLSYHFINLFLLLLGMSLSLGGDVVRKISLILSRQKEKDGAGSSGIIAAGLGLLISMAYWLGYSFLLTLGYTGAIPPIIAPWIIPSLFAMVSVYLYTQIPE